MNILRAYMDWCENLMSPQPMRERDLSRKSLWRLRLWGSIVCLWAYSVIVFAIILNDREALRAIIAPILKSNPSLLMIFAIVITFLLMTLVGILYLSSHRGLWRFYEKRFKLDEWELSQSSKISSYGNLIAIGVAGTVLFGLSLKGFFVGSFNLTAMHVGFIFAMSACLQIYGSFTAWAWFQKPLGEELNALQLVKRGEER